MAGYYLDSSALAKFYHPEAGSGAVEDLILHSAAVILISRLSVVELHSVFAGKVRTGVVSADEAAALRHRFLEDIANGLLGVVGLTSEHYEEAAGLIQLHGAANGLRTLDSLQLAVALSLQRVGAIENLVVGDKILCKVAAIEGMPVVNPESATP